MPLSRYAAYTSPRRGRACAAAARTMSTYRPPSGTMPVHEGGTATVVGMAMTAGTNWWHRRALRYQGLRTTGAIWYDEDDDDAVGVDGKMDDDVADSANEEALGWGSTRTGMGLRVQPTEGRVF